MRNVTGVDLSLSSNSGATGVSPTSERGIWATMKLGMVAVFWAAIAAAALAWFATQELAPPFCVRGSAAQIFTDCAER